MSSRRDQREDFDRIQRLFARSRRHRDLLSFREDLQRLLASAAQGPQIRPALPPPLQPTDPAPDGDDTLQQLNQALQDLLARVNARPYVETDRPDVSVDSVWWSSEPAYGIRAWKLYGQRFHGAKRAWPTNRMTAQCLHRANDSPSPHDVLECGSPPCGIYALKWVPQITGFAQGWFTDTNTATVAVGLVELTGRVIEHEKGYRAQHAEVVAAGFVIGIRNASRITWSDHPNQVAHLFEHPDTLLRHAGTDTRPSKDSFHDVFLRLEDRLSALREPRIE